MRTPHREVPSAIPELRQDLRLVGGITDRAGNRLWKVYDPIRHRYVALSRKYYALLDVWPDAASADAIAAAAWDRHAELVTVEDVQSFSQFLLSNGLALSSTPDAWRQSFAAVEKHRSAYMMRLVHNYLFFRVPLLRPEPFLRTSLPSVRYLGSWTTAIILALFAVGGLFLVSREWDRFLASAADLATLTGATGVVGAIVVVKVFHELGHGYTAVHFGCRVPSAGVAFILGAPLLYVDVTDSWKLASKKERLIIDVAGIAVDLAVSILATLLWVFLPDGTIKNAAFSFATAGWVTSLMFNLNPFMKFDGYHLIADGLSMPNFQDRAIEVARWRLREVLFGLSLPAPEALATRLRTAMVLYGWGIWLYRAVVFTGIAVTVYQYFFKAIGILLFAVEIGYFILAPLWRELKAWSEMRKAIATSRRAWTSMACLLVAIAALVTPWSTIVDVPAVLEPVHVAPLHIPVPAKVVSIAVESGTFVRAGAPLMELSSSNLEQELKLARLKADIIDTRLARLAGDASDRESAVVLERERLLLEQNIVGLRQRIAELRVVSPSSGTVTSLMPYASTGRWVTPQEPVAVLVSDKGARVRGLVEASDLARLRPGMRAKFIPNDLHQDAIDCIVTSVAQTNSNSLDQRELASSYGGTIATRLGKGGKAVPSAAQYAVTASIKDQTVSVTLRAVQPQPQIGMLIVHGDQQSILHRFWNRILIVLVRERGF